MRVLVVGGVDPSGGAGISADARTLQIHGAMALPVVAALTVQNRHGLQRVEPVRLELLRDALRATLDDGPVHAVKTGLLGGPEQIEALGGWLSGIRPRVPIVVDPVLSATAGGFSAGALVAAAYRRWLAPRARVFTPNLEELPAVMGDEPLARVLAEGCGAVLVKGGHGRGDELQDRLVQPTGERRWTHRRLPLGRIHGTGCALASAIAAGLAHGRGVDEVCGQAIEWLQRCLRSMPVPERADAPPRPLPLLA